MKKKYTKKRKRKNQLHPLNRNKKYTISKKFQYINIIYKYISKI